MRSNYFMGNKRFEVRREPVPRPGKNEVLVKVMACGICGTDVHIYHGEPGSAEVVPPVVLGHEFAGIVDAVKQAQDGDGVILRMYEAEGRRGDVTVILPQESKSVTENNLMEEPAETCLTHEGNAFTFTIKPFEVRTFRIG